MIQAPLRRFTVLFLAAASIAAASPALAGRWVPGGAFDPAQGVLTNFIRFLAEEGEGQMTIRCSAAEGLTIDVGVSGNATVPQGLAEGGEAAVDLVFGGAAQSVSMQVRGSVIVRRDGAVMVALSGADAAAVAGALRPDVDQVLATVGGVTRPVPLQTLTPLVPGFAATCAVWPV